MKSKDIIKQLLPGIAVGFILGFILVNLVGVNETDVIPNYIGGALCCLVPTLLNCLVVLKMTAKSLNRKLSFKDAILRTLPYLGGSIIIGLIVVIGLVEKVMGIDLRTISVLITAIYESFLGVVVSTLFAYIALKKYVKDVKYTKRNK